MTGWSLSVRLNPSKESTCPVEYPLWCIKHMGIRRSHLWKQVIELYLHPTKTNAFWKTERETCHVIWLQGKPLSNSIYQFIQMQDACTVLISQQIIHDSKLGRIRLKKFLVKLEEPFRRYKQTVLITTQVSKSNMMHLLSFPQVYP